MNSKKLFITGVITVFTLLSSSFAFADENYIRLSPDIRKNPQVEDLLSQNPNKVQVLEFFSYGCSACATFNPAFEQWAAKSKKNVVVYRMPVTFNQSEWESLANLYYIMRALDPSEKLNEKIFVAIHQQGQRLWEEPAMRKFFLENGYNETQFNAAYDKYSNNVYAKRSDDISDVYGVNATPCVIVNGPVASYMITINQDDDNYFSVLNQAISAASAK